MSWIIDLFKDIPQSAVLKERLSLAETKLVDSEKQNAVFKAKADARIAELESENLTLKSKLEEAQINEQQLRTEIMGLKDEIHQLTHVENLSDEMKAILVTILHEQDSLDAHYIAERIGLHPDRAIYLIHKLEKSEYVRSIRVVPGATPEYELTDKAREFLHQEDFI